MFKITLAQSVIQNQDVEKELQEIRLNLYKAHKQFKPGTALNLMGFPLMIAGFAIEDRRQNEGKKIALLAGGAVLSFVGSLIQMDSHKYIGRAGSPPPPKERKTRTSRKRNKE